MFKFTNLKINEKIKKIKYIVNSSEFNSFYLLDICFFIKIT
jgi:hypothetical protein